MEYKRFSNSVLIRLDIGEDVGEQVLSVAKKESISLASVSGIGGTNDFTVGVFSIEKNCYVERRFEGDHEITSIAGNITTMNGESYVHLHITCADGSGRVVGGHLLRARISISAEIILQICDGAVDRKHDETLNFNKLVFQGSAD